MRQIHLLTITVLIVISAVLHSSCSMSHDITDKLEYTESIIENEPDSALKILSNINPSELNSSEDKARYALLMSMALDKNWIDTTSFDILQPAIDYYLAKSNNRQKLFTYYYQGVIFFNRKDYANALSCFNNGKALGCENTDSLIYARLLVAQATIYYKLFKLREAIDNHIQSARIYNCLGKFKLEARSLSKALGESIMLNDKLLSDSLYNICTQRIASDSISFSNLKETALTYVATFGAEVEIRNELAKYGDGEGLSDEFRLNIANAYSDIREYDRAFKIIESIDSANVDKMKYLASKTDLLIKKGEHKQALTTYMEYVHELGLGITNLFEQDFIFAEERQQLEAETRAAQQSRRRIALWGGIALFAVLFAAGALGYDNRKKRRAYNALKIEAKEKNEKICSLNAEISELKEKGEGIALELERERRCVKPLSEPVRRRLCLTNLLLAELLAQRGKIQATPKEIDAMLGTRKEFIASTREVLSETNPKLIDALVKANLDDDEIGYMCLMAIGLKGKDAGEFMQNKRHYHMSSDIRRKLRLDEQDGISLSGFIRAFTDDYAVISCATED